MSQPAQQQDPPGTEQQMRPVPDHGEASYRGSGRLAGKAAVLTAMFRLCKATVPHMPAGGSIIGTTSVNSDMPTPQLLPYDVTKAGVANFMAGLAQLLAEKGIRANSVAPGPIWTPLIPSTMPEEQVESFGQQVPLGRAGQPAELAPVYVLLASDDGSYVSGARVAVTGGTPIL